MERRDLSALMVLALSSCFWPICKSNLIKKGINHKTQRCGAVLPGLKSTRKGTRDKKERSREHWQALRKPGLTWHLNGMDNTQLNENIEIYCFRKIFSTDLLLFISKTFSPEECCWWWSEIQALKKKLTEPLALSYSGGNTQVTA